MLQPASYLIRGVGGGVRCKCSFISTFVGWVAGSGAGGLGVIVKTTDSGSAWTLQLNAFSRLNAIQVALGNVET